MTHIIVVTAEDIANGVPGDSCRCPIALAITRQLRTDRVVVGANNIYIDDRLRAHLPEIAMNFIIYFDTTNYVEPFEFDVEFIDYDPIRPEELYAENDEPPF